MNIAAYLKEQYVLITDGAMGTCCQKKYKDEQIFVERANTEAPERVKEIHLDYIAAGAKLIRTNTFATNTMFFDTMEEVTENIKAGYQIAEKAVAESGSEVFIAADSGTDRSFGRESETLRVCLRSIRRSAIRFLRAGQGSFCLKRFRISHMYHRLRLTLRRRAIPLSLRSSRLTRAVIPNPGSA